MGSSLIKQMYCWLMKFYIRNSVAFKRAIDNSKLDKKPN